MGRYHSLVVELDSSSAPHLTVTVRSDEGETMGFEHRYEPTCVLQCQPESIITDHGQELLTHFLQVALRAAEIE
ncbi:hypothetical protein QRQ56_35395 [Bradyrhizobium sp. U531]|uniref:glutamine amidotransferase-related protein n=1 Tax=Bradyrhizobium sp. U531 TaxID=3053458 RepID=UPI003F42DBEB